MFAGQHSIISKENLVRDDAMPLRSPTSVQAMQVALLYPPELLEALDMHIQHSLKNNSQGALLLVSISNVAMILSAYGHDATERAMASLMQRIGQILQNGQTIQRITRDQFAVILPHSFPDDTQWLANRVHSIIQHFGRDHLETVALHLIGEIGSAQFPDEAAHALDALDKATIALQSGQVAPHKTFFAAKPEADLCRQQMGLASYLFKAFTDSRLRLAYQPVVASKTGEVVHYEALLRMVGPTGTISTAGALIPIAEKMGLIDLIDEMVMNKVVDELRHSTEAHLAFNVSNLTTDNQVWLDKLTALLKETPEIAPRLIVEITETAAQRDLRRTAYFVASLQSMGCQVALDDFGSGYTSFRQLKALSVDMVKIDGVFVKDLSSSSDNRFFVKTLLDFAQGFGLTTVAEFVETGDIAKILMEMGCDQLQGYYFGKPHNHRSWLNEGEYRK